MTFRTAILPRLGALLALALAPSARAADVDFDALVAAERAFAATSPREGVDAAFRAWLAPDAIMFRPGPVRAAEHFARTPPRDSPILLDWAPEHGEVSASGDLGWTIGPALFRPKAEPEKRTGTHFFSIWQRNAEGEFRNVLDVGVDHAPVELAREVTRHGARGSAKPLAPPAAAVRLQALVSADRALAARLATAEAAEAWRAIAASDAFVLRPGALPLTGDAALARVVQVPAMDLASLRIAAAGDLAGTAGWGGDPERPHVYQRAWRWVDGGWRVVVDLVIP